MGTNVIRVIKLLLLRIEALEAKQAYYRTGRPVSEAVHKKMDRTQKAVGLAQAIVKQYDDLPPHPDDERMRAEVRDDSLYE